MLLLAFLATGLVAPQDSARAAAPTPAPLPVPVPSSTPADDPAADAAIVPDSQFEQALPPLDAELAQPLAPIEPLDAAPPATTAEATPAPPPTGTAAAPVVTAADPAFAQPLPPLATFDVEPVQVAAADPEAAPAIRYDVKVEGLDAAGLTGRFRGLSALVKGDGEGSNGAVIAARAREDEALALRIARSEGYYDAVATSLVEPVAEGTDGRVVATVSVSLGARYNLGTIAVTGPDTVPAGMPREILGLKTGEPIVAARVEGAEAGIALQLPQRGYPFVSVGQRDIALDDADHSGDYTLPVDPGPRSSFGGYTTTGDLAFDAEHVGVLARFKRGQLYDNRRVDDLREAMVATGLFRSVAIEPQRTGEIAPDGTEYVNLLVTQNAGPPRRLAATGGYSTGQGLRLEGSWTHRNLFKPEGALIAGIVAGTQEQGVNGTFRRSNAGKRDRTVQLALGVLRQDYDAFDAQTISLNGRISRDSTPIWQKKWTYAYGFEALATRERGFDATTGDRTRQDYFIGGLNGQIGFDSSNSLLDPTRGFRALVRLSPEVSQSQGSNDQYVRGLVEGSTYLPLNESFTLAARARVGSIVGAPRDAIAPSRRLYAGGGGSVRGFGYQGLGPRDADDRPIGGRSLVEAAFEARYRFGNFGIVPFVDVGQVYDSSTPGFSDLRAGVGIGGRYYTNFGPFRFDVATPLGKRPGESRINIYISIGQAF